MLEKRSRWKITSEINLFVKGMQTMSESNGYATLAELKNLRPRTSELEIEGVGKIFLQQLDHGQRDEFEQLCVERAERKNYKGMKAQLISMCWVDHQTRKPVAAPTEFRNVPSAVVDQMYDECVKLNRMTSFEVEKEAKN